MEHVAIDNVDAGALGQDIDRRGLTEPLGTSDLAINHYRLDPGERLSGGMHAHMDQEEVFVVLSGKVTFETADGDVTVGADEAIRFAPGDFQSGVNQGDDELRVLALGGPRDSEDVRVPQECPECDHENVRAVPADDGFDFVCPECGAEKSGGDDVDTQENEMGSIGP